MKLTTQKGRTLSVVISVKDADGEPYTLDSFPKMWKRCGTNDY